MNFHSRQKALIGPKNQEKLALATVGIIGVGALGSCVAHLLARMGVGNLVLFDDDVVADHNLARQHLYTVEDIDSKKVEACAKHIKEIAPDVHVEMFNMKLTADDGEALSECSLIVDGTDNHASRRVIDTLCKEKNLSWVHGAAIEEKGTVVFFDSDLSYDDVYGNRSEDQHCSISGVLATATTLVGTMQCQLVLKFLLGEEIPKEMIHINGMNIEKIKI